MQRPCVVSVKTIHISPTACVPGFFSRTWGALVAIIFGNGGIIDFCDGKHNFLEYISSLYGKVLTTKKVFTLVKGDTIWLPFGHNPLVIGLGPDTNTKDATERFGVTQTVMYPILDSTQALGANHAVREEVSQWVEKANSRGLAAIDHGFVLCVGSLRWPTPQF